MSNDLLGFRLLCFVDGDPVETAHVFSASNVEIEMVKSGQKAKWIGSGHELMQRLADLCTEWEDVVDA